MTLSFDGEWWNDNFGNVDNTIKTIEYYYKKTTDTTWTKGNVAIIPTINENNFSGSILIEGPNADDKGFDVSTSYNIKMSVTDALATSTEYQTILGTGTPAIAICDNKVAIGQKYDEDLGGALQVKGEVIEQGLRVSPTQPETNEKIWIQKGKNLSKKSGFDAVNSDIGIATVKTKVEPNTSYTISAIKSRIGGVNIANVGFQGIGAIKAYDVLGNIVEDLFRDNAHYLESGSVNIEFPITTPANCDYIIVDFGNNNGDFNFNISVSQIQIEQGSTATPYEAHIEKAIYVKNDNGVYEEFVNTE